MRLTFSAGVRLSAAAALLALALTNPHVRAAAGLQSGIDLSNLDRTCKPCSDFYQFADGGWIRNNPIPAAYPGFGSFQKLADHNQEVLHQILDATAAQSAAPGSNDQKIRDFYSSCMDVKTIDAAGIKPIEPLLTLASGANAENMGQTLAQLQAANVNAFFGFGPSPDFKNSTQNLADLSQGGLGLPDRDYYTRTDEKSKAILAEYQTHVQKMFELLGDPPATAATEAASVLKTETALAKNQLTIVQQRDPAAVYHKMTVADAQKIAPELQFASFFTANTVPDTVSVNVEEPGYFKAVSQQIASMPASDLHTYLRWQVVDAYANALPQAFVDEQWNFFNKTLEGSRAQLPRWKKCVRATDNNLGEALGQLYVQKTFPPSAKASALAMVENIKAELRDDLSTLTWMSPQTRSLAVKKLDAFELKIGYPNKWRDYSKFNVTRGPYAANVLASAQFQTDYQNAKIGHPVDRTEWGMTPPTVNAYYNPTINEIVFPAGIMQPPFFNKDADMAVNYGGIGAVIGHESTHGFDDSGRKFDAVGNLTDWWTPGDASRFNARTQCIVNEWNTLQPMPGVHEIGKQVEGEEIADLGGLTIAYKAFEKWQAHNPRRVIDGFTPEQRFFLGWAQVWASSYRPEYIRLLAQTDVHGYDKFRVNQTLSDMPQFAKAFFCKLNDPMVRPKAQQCQIW
ncbi:MAG TPA: M13 family metallopeptidase [Candidatus Baltobacteraceae bacterium]|jgi:putative endopeptidase|nr:M13 family metallopeptidase [Candidatus Baltobacteraceae bacterium]